MIADSSTALAPGARPFLLPGSSTGILLVHGYGGSIGDFRLVAERLHRDGYTVSGLRLPGHGIDLPTLARTSIEEMRQAVHQGIDDLRVTCSCVIVVGTSFGAALALDAAIMNATHVHGVVLINPALGYRQMSGINTLALRLLRLATPYFRKTGFQAADREMYRQLGSMTHWPIDGIFATKKFIESHILPSLPKVHVPTLILVNEDDPVVRPESSVAALDSLGTALKRVATIPGKTHRPLREPEAVAFIAEQIQQFLKSAVGRVG